RIFNIETGHVRDIAALASEISAVAFHPDGGLLASAGKDGLIHVWQADRGQVLATFALDGSLPSLAFSPDGKTLAVGGDTAAVNLWDVAALLREGSASAPRQILRGHSQKVTDLSFSIDSRRLATCSFDRTVKLWDVASGHEALTLRNQGGIL